MITVWTTYCRPKSIQYADLEHMYYSSTKRLLCQGENKRNSIVFYEEKGSAKNYKTYVIIK